MMNVEALVCEIKKQAPEMEISVHYVQKGNATLTGIAIGNGTVRPTVYMEHFELIYLNSGYSSVARKMIRIAKEAMKDNIAASKNISKFTTYEHAKDNLRLCIAPKGTNKDFLTYPYLDLEMYVRVMVESTESGNASYKVKAEMLENWGITKKQLLNRAMMCTKPLYNVKSMGETLYELTGDETYLDEAFAMIVANTKDNYNGASVIYFKDILEEVANKWNDDLVIIPSSIHECILKPLSDMTVEEVSEIVTDVNADVLEPEEVLSDHAYVFHRDTMEITW